ncbi:MAG: stealth family protein [Arenimonas sp.]
MAGASPVDAVITWVDGNDPEHAHRRAQVLGADAVASHAAAAPTRFGDCGEVAWCVSSLLRFAPWLRTIWIVADDQRPAFLDRIGHTAIAGRVRVVDHREIFDGYERYLPTFSNRSIEAMLHRIPGLAPRFLYLNDDFMLLQPVALEDFFRAQGVVLRGRWRDGAARARWPRWRAGAAALLRGGRSPARVARPGQHAAQQRSAQLAGFGERYFQFPHCPAPLRRDTIGHWFEAHPEQLERNISFRMRSAEQFLTVALANHLELAGDTAIIDNRLGTLRLQPARLSPSALHAGFARADADPALAFLCLQSLDEADAGKRAQVEQFLARRIGPPL